MSPNTPFPPPQTRLVLRPGAHAVRRDDRHLQVGLDAPARAVLPATPEVEALLDALTTGSHVVADEPREAGSSTDRVLRDLVDTGLVVDAEMMATARRRWDRTVVDVAVARRGPSALGALEARAQAAVTVDAPPNAAGDAIAVLLSGHLERAGVTVRRSAVPTPYDAPGAHLHLVVRTGPFSRRDLDPVVGSGHPHLVLAAGTVGWRVGPLVVPGSSACQRCVDAAESASDPRRLLVLEQVADRAAPDVGGDVVTALAVAWAARDTLAYLDGGLPSTWSATVDLDDLSAPEVRGWQRHPHCGCAWDQIAYY